MRRGLLQFIVLTAGLESLVSQLLRTSPVMLASELETQLHLNAPQISAASSAFFLGALLGVLPGSVLVDRFGPRSVFGGGASVLLAGGAMWFAVAGSLPALIAARFIMGLGSAPLTTATLAAVASIGPPQAFAALSGEQALSGRIGSDRNDEAAYEILIRAYVRAGNTAGALREYRTYSDHFMRDLGVSPTFALDELLDVSASAV